MSTPPSYGQDDVMALARKGSLRSIRARIVSEAGIIFSLRACAYFSIFTTAVILVMLSYESIRFFREVSIIEFFTTFQWSPLLGKEQHFGIWPLVCGTLLVTLVAAIVALPIGLVSAIYLSEYASPKTRTVLKPVLEVLAGIPSVVYGFFALIVITPALQGIAEFTTGGAIFGGYSAAAAGLAVAIMILPIVTSLSDDALRAVPKSLRDGAYALGATRFDVSVKVVVPAALSGVIASYLLAITRAVGETMIVALAAGGLAKMTILPWSEVLTMTGYMVKIFTGDAPATGVEYKSSFAVATVLFAMTFILTFVGYRILAKFREEYE